MKELSVKEKAQRYDEALSLMQDCIPDEDGLVHVKPDEIFPELKESEDERIRKRLIEIVQRLGEDSAWFGDISQGQTAVLAWLEKQDSYV